MNEWTWEYDPDAEHVVGDLPSDAKARVESLAQRLADAAAVKYLAEPPIEDSGVSGIKDHAEGRIILWFLEHRRLRLILVLRVQFWPPEREDSIR